jgi:hypothetical protein
MTVVPIYPASRDKMTLHEYRRGYVKYTSEYLRYGSILLYPYGVGFVGLGFIGARDTATIRRFFHARLDLYF